MADGCYGGYYGSDSNATPVEIKKMKFLGSVIKADHVTIGEKKTRGYLDGGKIEGHAITFDLLSDDGRIKIEFKGTQEVNLNIDGSQTEGIHTGGFLLVRGYTPVYHPCPRE